MPTVYSMNARAAAEYLLGPGTGASFTPGDYYQIVFDDGLETAPIPLDSLSSDLRKIVQEAIDNGTVESVAHPIPAW